MERKVAVVTGAGSGIGAEVTRALAGAGYRVALAGRRADPLRAVAAEIADAGALVVPTDVSDAESVAALFDAVRGQWGRVDVLFNNAGLNGGSANFGDYPVDRWTEVVAVNLTGAFLCAREAFRTMRGQEPGGGRIINNGSISAHAPRPGSVGYTATKHAITGLTKSIALDGRPYRIACGQIDIGNAATEMTERMSAGVPQADGSVAAEPVMDVRNVAEAVRYMAGLPLDANVPFMTVMATNMPYIGRG
ncbi:MAG TPA: SDR family oxidoreductase [Streptosporangiaceae bacterium]|jgi:NADP-dependent 3-hydroxy acid dehydrogenase YdfG